MSGENIKEVVREKYGKAALQAASGSQACCGGSSCCETDIDPITAGLYDESADSGVCLGGCACVAGMWEPNGPGAAQPGRNRSRSWFGRRHRCAPCRPSASVPRES